jgi:hypothetical protein
VWRRGLTLGVGDHGIEIRDEIDLVLPLRAVDSPKAFL